MRVQAYRAPLWLPGGNAQTVYAALFAPLPRIAPRRERWETPDGDFIHVERLDGPRDAPLFVLFHGLEGGARSHYVRAILHAVRAHGWRAAMPLWRGCSGEPNLLQRAYHSGDAAEIDWILRRFAAEGEGAPLYAAGVSLGGNVLLKWLGESDDAALRLVRGAVSVCAPLDLSAAADALERGFNRAVYTRMFLATLKRKTAEKLQRFPALCDGERMRRARTLREFDDVVTAPLHGFRDAADYYARSSAKPWLRSIRVPTLVLNARNDPFLPSRHLPRADDVSPCVTLEFPPGGGHLGFVDGPFPGGYRWLPARIIEFLSHPHMP